jgi:hypothetical protein
MPYNVVFLFENILNLPISIDKVGKLWYNIPIENKKRGRENE